MLDATQPLYPEAVFFIPGCRHIFEDKMLYTSANSFYYKFIRAIYGDIPENVNISAKLKSTIYILKAYK